MTQSSTVKLQKWHTVWPLKKGPFQTCQWPLRVQPTLNHCIEHCQWETNLLSKNAGRANLGLWMIYCSCTVTLVTFQQTILLSFWFYFLLNELELYFVSLQAIVLYRALTVLKLRQVRLPFIILYCISMVNAKCLGKMCRLPFFVCVATHCPFNPSSSHYFNACSLFMQHFVLLRWIKIKLFNSNAFNLRVIYNRQMWVKDVNWARQVWI